MVIVRQGETVETLYRLVRPAPNYYLPFNTQIHGMNAADTEGALPFPAVWAEIAPRLAGLTLVAHNSPFDQGCLRAAHAYYGLPCPDYRFACTCRAARRLLGATLPNHQLHTVAQHCGYSLKHHHHALADAEACAAIALKLL